MKIKNIFPLLLIYPLLSCSQSPLVVSDRIFCFDTSIEVRLYGEGNEEDLKNIKNILGYYAGASDNFYQHENNVYCINTNNEEVEVDERLYNLLKTSYEVKNDGADYFNILCGTLSAKWKIALSSGEVLSDEVIASELENINNSSLIFKDNNVIQRLGEATIDLGGIAKGYTLDVAKEYLQEKEIKNYIINAGYSSILLGEKKSDNGYFTVGIKDLNRAYFLVKNCVISTSGNSEQGEHIVNPITGQLANNYDTVIVIGEEGAHGDALSTSLMLSTIEEIQQIETEQNIKVLVIKNKSILYRSSGLEVYYR